MSHSVLCVGQASVEWVGQMPRFPVRQGDRQELSAFSLQGGGAAANAAVTLAALGARALFAGVLADDFLGDLAAEGLVDAGVDLRYLRRHEGGVSPASFVALDEERRRPTVFWTRGTAESLRPGEVPDSALQGVSLLLVDGYQPVAQLALVEAARARGVKTLLCARAMAPGMAQLAGQCDVVIASERFAREVAPVVPRSLAEMLALGARVAVVTLGEDGSVGQARGEEPVKVEAFPVPLVDPTGSGDVYRGAFAWALLERKPLREAMRFGSAAASLKCRHYGAREGVPTRALVDEVLAR
jgi:sulfofructose kinase